MIKWICSYLGRSKKLLAAILVLGVTTVVFAVGLMFVAGYLISASADNAYSLLMLNIPLAFVQIFGLGKPIARYFERLKSHDWVLRLTSDLRYRLFKAVQAQERQNKHWQTGEILGSLASDIEHVQNLFLRTIFPILIAWICGILLVLIAGCMSLLLFVFALGMMVLLCVILPLLAYYLNRARIERVNHQRADLYARVTDAVLGAQDIAISGRGKAYAQSFLERFSRLQHDERMVERRDRARLILIQVFLLVSILVLVWWASVRFGRVAGGSADWIIAIALGFFPLIEVFAPLSQELENGVSYRESFMRLHERGLLAALSQSHRNTPGLTQPLDIALSNVSFSYDQKRSILKNISLEIPYGQKVALLGKSGSGKTTLAHVIKGDSMPSAGEVTIAGVPVAQLRGEIWDNLGFISQDSYVFAMSIMDNLRIGKIEITEDEAWNALDSVGLKEHVASLPEGLETMASEAGLNLSGGQRQRLALARVLLQDPPIVVLDEPTVGLDPITEQTVLDTISRVFADKTVIMITHHLQGVEAFDRVIFIEEGELVMDGDPYSLLRENERYAKLRAFDRGSIACGANAHQ